MNLTSCDRCGVVIDLNKVIFPDVYDHDTQEVIDGNSEWDGRDYVSVISCPVCGANVRENG